MSAWWWTAIADEGAWCVLELKKGMVDGRRYKFTITIIPLHLVARSPVVL
jgi:hypothetical protein